MGAADSLDPEVKYREPLLVKSRDGRHVVGLFPLIFPALTAPFVALLGFRGLYALPALSVAAIFAGVCFISRRCKQPHPILTGLCAVAITPVLFYGAEFWEHAPAAALTTWAVALAVTGCMEAMTIRKAGLIGGLIGLASAFRPEAILLAPAMAAAGWIVAAWQRPLHWAALPFGTLVVWLGVLSIDWSVYGTAISPHFTTTFNGDWAGFWATRGEVIRATLFPNSPYALLAAACAGAGVSMFCSPQSAGRVAARHAAVMLLLWAGVGEPAWLALRHGTLVHGVFRIGSLACTWPFAFPLLYLWPRPSGADGSRASSYLLWTVGLFIALAVAAMPNAGGAQWGARYLLPAAPLTAILVFTIVDRAHSSLMYSRSAKLVTAAVIGLSLPVQVLGLCILYQDKMMYASLGRVIEQSTDEGEIVISDLFWVPETVARLYGSRVLLFASSATDLEQILQLAAATDHHQVAVITSRLESGWVSRPTYQAAHGVRFSQVSHHEILSRRTLTLDRYASSKPAK